MHLDSDRNHEKSSAAHPFVSGVESYIRRNRLLSSPQVQTDNGITPTVIVALSGGADSVALLAALVALGYNCRAAHCNFHLRGEESNRDMRHAAAICERLGVEMHLRHFTGIEKQCNLSGHSVEMVCFGCRTSCGRPCRNIYAQPYARNRNSRTDIHATPPRKYHPSSARMHTP